MKSKLALIALFLSFFVQIVSADEAIATVTKFRGSVQLKSLTQGSFLTVEAGQSVYSGDIVKVGDPGFCMVIFLDDKSILKIRESTEFQFVETENTRTIDIEFGRILSEIKKEKKKDFRLETPVSVASVKATKFWVESIGGTYDKFYGLEGTVDVFNTISGQTISLGPGQMTLSTATGQLVTTPVSPEEVPRDPEAGIEEEKKVEEKPKEIEEFEEEIPKEIEEAPEEEMPKKEIEAPKPEEIEQPPPEEFEARKEEAPKPEAEKPFNMGLGLGSATIDGVIYNQFALRPEFRFGKLGVGLDLVLYVDNEGNIRKEEWDEPTDLVDKFLYVRWGEKSDPVWFSIGALESVTLGYGGLLGGYSNMMEFPSVRRVGFDGGVNMGGIGAELFLANVKDFKRGGTLMGIRGSYRVSKKFPLTVGANLVLDINQFSGLKDQDEDSYPDIFDDFPNDKKLWNDTDGDGIPDPHEGLDLSKWDIDADGDNLLSSLHGGNDVEVLKPDPFSIKENKGQAVGFAVDVGYPVLRSKIANINVFAEFNRLSFPKVEKAQFSRPEKSGSGITIPGIRANVLKFLNLSFEYRIKREYFVPQFFDQAYDLNRVIPIYEGESTQIFTKDMLVFQDSASVVNSSGYFGSAGADLFNLVKFTASYTNMVADTTEFNSFFALTSINTQNIPKLSEATAYYQRNNEKNPFDFKHPSVNTILGYRLGYEIGKGVSLVWDFRQFYRDTGGGLEPVRQTTIETQFSF